MKLVWSTGAWADYIDWQETDPKIVRKINRLIEDIRRSPFRGLGHPEPLKHGEKDRWSRHITEEHRLVYRVTGSGADQRIEVAQCRGHY